MCSSLLSDALYINKHLGNSKTTCIISMRNMNPFLSMLMQQTIKMYPFHIIIKIYVVISGGGGGGVLFFFLA